VIEWREELKMESKEFRGVERDESKKNDENCRDNACIV
jgi:hypothetical protein